MAIVESNGILDRQAPCGRALRGMRGAAITVTLDIDR
jgi:hypothetical protein